MSPEVRLQQRAQAAAEFDQHLGRGDGERVAGSLFDGLGLLADLFLTRVHVDVQRNFGMDSMLIPTSIVKSEEKAKTEIELYLASEAAAQARACGYVPAGDEWFTVWLARLRIGDAATGSGHNQRLAQYAARSSEDRRRSFSTVLERTLPEASRAPLVLYRLVPLAAAVAASVAFGDHVRALEAREKQESVLAGITDCSACHGGVLENGDRCGQCGNPLWRYDWLTAE